MAVFVDKSDSFIRFGIIPLVARFTSSFILSHAGCGKFTASIGTPNISLFLENVSGLKLRF